METLGLLLLELCGSFRAAGGVAARVRVSADTSELAVHGNDVVLVVGLAIEEALEDLADAGSVAGLGREGRAGDVGRHGVVGHGAPGMVLGRRLGEPDIAGVASKVTRLEGSGNGVLVADLAASSVDDVGAALHLLDHFLVEHVLCLRVEGAVDGHDVADLDKALGVLVPGEVEFLLDLGREAVAVGVVKLDIKGVEAAQDRKANATGSNSANVHTLDIIGALDAVGDVPAALADNLVRWDVVADKTEDHHDDVLGDGDAVAEGDLHDGDVALHGGIEVDVVRANACSDAHLEVGRLFHALLGDVGWPEGLRDDHIGILHLLFENAVGAVLVAGHDKRMAAILEKLAQAKLARHAAEELARSKVALVGVRGKGDLGDLIARILWGVACLGVVVQSHDDFRVGSARCGEGAGSERHGSGGSAGELEETHRGAAAAGRA
eukprot:m.285082 g.285082  ORF g.285082 m.285082 type:complete len:437 (+) comp11291_c0_seq1:127-1437(+)